MNEEHIACPLCDHPITLPVAYSHDDLWIVPRHPEYGVVRVEDLKGDKCEQCENIFITSENARYNERITNITRNKALIALLENLFQDAERWRALINCDRIRIMGTARLGTASGHIGLELWGKHPPVIEDNEGKDVLIQYADGLRKNDN